MRIGARVKRSTVRHYFGRVFATAASMLLKIPVYDTQCGAKTFRADLAKQIFAEPFISSWLFDVELMARILSLKGKAITLTILLEVPLHEWIDKKGSKIRIKHLLALALMGTGIASCSSNQGPLTIPLPTEQDLRRANEYAQEAQKAAQARDFGRAVELNNKALSLRPDLGGVWNNLGLALMSRGTELDYVQAADAFRRAADLLPIDERPYQNLGVLYHNRGFSEDALRYFSMALDRNPHNKDCLRGAVGSAKRLLRSDEACLERVNRALMIDDDTTWRQIEQFEKLRIQQDLAERARTPTT